MIGILASLMVSQHLAIALPAQTYVDGLLMDEQPPIDVEEILQVNAPDEDIVPPLWSREYIDVMHSWFLAAYAAGGHTDGEISHEVWLWMYLDGS
ncbi:MAG: hypothetical protein B7733_08555 [Myxococcales bacterium FL481]|nr:MAG: hypothetical protein B7733_08555 [Myxococcales bacterium FL481]